MTPKILIAHWAGIELLDAAAFEALGKVGVVLDTEPVGAWDDPRADALLAEAEVIVGHWGCPRIDAGVLARAPHLGLIAYAAGTVKAVVDQAVFDAGIRVTSAADANAEPVAEFTLAAILFAGKDVLWRRDALRDREIRSFRPPSPVPVGNWDKTIGIVGASLVGRRVIELLRPFPKLRVSLYDPFVTEGEAARLGVDLYEDLDELCAASDVLSIHAPDVPATRSMVGADQLARLRDGATLINTARGALLDHDALTSELQAGRLYAILDVSDPEPLPRENPLRTLPNVFLTPHLAGSEGTELGRLAAAAVDEIRRWAKGDDARNGVTLEQLARMA